MTRPMTTGEPMTAQRLFRADDWLAALRLVAHHYRLPGPAENSKLASLWHETNDPRERARLMARGAGLRLHFLPQGDDLLTPERLPIIVQFADGSPAVVRSLDAGGPTGTAACRERVW